MAAEKLLTEAACKAAKAKAKLYYLNDGAGLRLRIRPDGSRTWIYRYKLDGKETSTGLGAYPTVALQVARAKALEAKQHVSKGDNASTAKLLAKANQIIKGDAAIKGDEIGYLDKDPVRAPATGVLRGISRNKAHVVINQKMIEVDPSKQLKRTGIGERPLKVAKGVIHALKQRHFL
jgi:hypothetical protein